MRVRPYGLLTGCFIKRWTLILMVRARGSVTGAHESNQIYRRLSPGLESRNLKGADLSLASDSYTAVYGLRLHERPTAAKLEGHRFADFTAHRNRKIDFEPPIHR